VPPAARPLHGRPDRVARGLWQHIRDAPPQIEYVTLIRRRRRHSGSSQFIGRPELLLVTQPKFAESAGDVMLPQRSTDGWCAILLNSHLELLIVGWGS
jgi:hypothetical protein